MTRFRVVLTILLVIITLLACTPASQPVRQPDPTNTPKVVSTAPGDPTRSPAATPTPGAARPSTPAVRPPATPSPTFTLVPPRTFVSGSPVIAGANRLPASGQCYEIATGDRVAIVETTSPPSQTPAHPYQRVPARQPSIGAVNLLPDTSGGLPGLDVHAVPGVRGSGPLDVKSPAFVDWTIRNAGPDPVPSGYVTDIYFDDIFVSRWQGVELPRGGSAGIRDWTGIHDVIRILPGRHVVRLVIDATDQIAETDESDNVMEITLDWGGDVPERQPALRLPDLAVAPIAPGAPAILASNNPAARTGHSPSSDFVTYLSWTIENTGLASVADRVPIHLYFNDIFVTSRIANGIVASGISVVDAWDGLAGVVDVKPGNHVLKIVVDPGNLIHESNEANNVQTLSVTWTSGQPVPSEAGPATVGLSARRQAQTAANLTPEIPRGWDGPVVVNDSAIDSPGEGHEGAVVAGKAWRINFAVTNASPIATGGNFEIAVSVDGKRIGTERFRGGPADSGGLWTGSVEVGAGQFGPGTHTITLDIDPSDAIREGSQADHRCERQVTLLAESHRAPADVSYDEAALRDLVSALPELLLETRDLGARTPATAGHFNQIMRVAEAANFHLTGRSLMDDRLDVHLLPRVEYDRATLSACMARASAMSQPEFTDLLTRCTTERVRESGLQTVEHGRVAVFVDTDQSPPAVLSTLFHELGHARQSLLSKPVPGEGQPGPAAKALHEAQAQIYEAAMWRGIEKFSGVRLGEYPDFDTMRSHVDQLRSNVIDGAGTNEEHDLGYVLLWLHALKDPGGRGYAEELRAAGRLSAASTLVLYNDLLLVSDADATLWANELLDGGQALIDEFAAISDGRLVVGLTYADEAHPALIEQALIAP